MTTKYFRQSYVAVAIFTIIALIACYFIGIPMPEWVNPLILKIVYVFVAFGILVQTSDEAQKLTFSTVIQKFASPVTLGALYALYKFLVEVNFDFASSEWYTLLGQILMVVYGLVNDSNNKKALVNNVALIE